MSLHPIFEEVINSYNNDIATTERKLTATQDEAALLRTLNVLVLPEIDEVYDWPCAVVPFSKIVAAGDNDVDIITYPIFKPVICYATGQDDPLDFYEITDFLERSAAYGRTKSNSAPIDYSLSGNKLLVGPGVMASATTVSGDVRRRLNQDDLDFLPPQLCIYGLLKALHKAGSPGSIKAWSGWKIALGSAANYANKKTGESRTIRTTDPQITANNRYKNSLW
jgi:hypothetical protein